LATRHDPSDGLSRLADLLEDAPRTASRRPLAPVDPVATRRRRRRGLIATAIVVVALGGLVGSYAAWALGAPVGAPVATTHRPDVPAPAAAAIAMPSGEAAVSVAGGDAYLGPGASGIWKSAGGDAALPMASISKLITAMVVLDRKPLASPSDAGPTLTFSKADHDLYDKYYLLNATIAAMPTNSTMSEHDALETMLVVSACNYAEAVSDWAFGSQAAFLGAARSWMTAHGLTHTTMVESTGIDDRNRSTPADLIALGKLAMADPVIASIVAKPVLDVPRLQGSNTNGLLGTEGIDGIKTGTLGDSSDLLFSSRLPVPGLKDPLTVIGVVLGGSSRAGVDGDVTRLLKSIANGFHRVDLAHEGDVVGTYSTPWGAEATMVIGASETLLTWSDTAITSTMSTTKLTTGADGERVGSITWASGDDTVTAPVVLEGSIAPPSAWWRLTHPFELGR
jgi:D-alanyl-D-alanine carboxypeptidase (penicillin-binding protein 5/6)